MAAKAEVTAVAAAVSAAAGGDELILEPIRLAVPAGRGKEAADVPGHPG